MTALDLFREQSIDQDKYESATYSIRDFNYFNKAAVDELVRSKYVDGPDGEQAIHDDIKVLLSDPIPLSFGSGTSVSLPDLYRNLLDLNIGLEMLVDKGKYKKGDILTSFPRKKRSSRKGYIEKNSYQKSSLDRTWYRLRGNTISIDIDPDTKIVSGTMEMLKVPNVIYLHPDYKNLSDEEKALEENNTTIQFPVSAIQELNRICKRIVLENIESGRYQSAINENFLATK